MEVKYLTIKFMKGNFGLLDTLYTLSKKDYEFFKKMLAHAEDDLFLSGEKQDKIMKELGISRTTYWARINSAVDKGIIYKSSRSIYRFNDKWLKLVTLDVKVVGATRETTKSNQKLIDLKF